MYRLIVLYVLVDGVTGAVIDSLMKSTACLYPPWNRARLGGDMPGMCRFDGAPPGSCVPRGSRH